MPYKNVPELLSTWKAMKQRCYNVNSTAYKRYGGRGISVCPEWRENFRTFESWALSKGWKRGLQIDRINNNGNYSPENCQLLSPSENLAKAVNFGRPKKAVRCIETGKIYNSAAEAVRQLNIKDKTAVKNAANPNHNRTKAGGFTWEYV